MCVNMQAYFDCGCLRFNAIGGAMIVLPYRQHVLLGRTCSTAGISPTPTPT
jgi:hypothetical protein